MGDTGQESMSEAAGIDLSQFYQVFFEEAGENLETMEQKLLTLDIENADDEELNAIFRCAHSVKGGAATFGFADVAELTHQMETLLDKLRRHELQPHAAMVDVLLAAGDALQAQLARHQGSGQPPVDTRELLRTIKAQTEGAGPAPSATPTKALTSGSATHWAQMLAATSAVPVAAGSSTGLRTGERQLELWVGPLTDLADAENVVDLFKEVIGLGTIEALDGGHGDEGMRRFKVVTSSSDEDLLDLMGFHLSRDKMRLGPLGADYGFHDGAPGAPGTPGAPPLSTPAAASSPAAAKQADDPGFGFFDGTPGAPGLASTATPTATTTAAPKAAATRPDKAPTPESSTLRVSIEKVDQLINLVGELVITQAMLAQNGKGLDSVANQQMLSGLADLDRNTRDLQEAVMSIRMIPMSLVFSRFPRMLRDLAGKLGKKVELVQVGEATELDKGLVEKITDPLTHLVRNSCDHGIEMPADRLAQGKPEHGTVTLMASHQGGSIVIEVRDDGKGLKRNTLLKKARERGLDVSDSMSDQEVFGLIFAPGFSTADQVTDVSGRGVGMDVVKKNITSLGGTVEIDSAEGMGMTVRVRLPLTLAIMDGMSVGVGHECYILPLSSVVESFQVQPGMVKTIGGHGRVVEVRDEYMPIVELESLFKVPRRQPRTGSAILVVVEAEGGRVALMVDELLGQQQVVVKNLESNYRRVDDVSGATILGDGRVALILDVSSLIRRSNR